MKNKIILTIGNYTAKIRDYKYKSKPPVGVIITGNRLGECKNVLGEDCYYFKSADAMSMHDGITIAKQIINERTRTP